MNSAQVSAQEWTRAERWTVAVFNPDGTPHELGGYFYEMGDDPDLGPWDDIDLYDWDTAPEGLTMTAERFISTGVVVAWPPETSYYRDTVTRRIDENGEWVTL